MPDDAAVTPGRAFQSGSAQTPGGGWVPVPDPTELTTEAVEKATAQYRRELAALREIIETRLAGNDEQRTLLWAEIRSWPESLDRRLEMRRREFLDDLQGVRELGDQRHEALNKAISVAAAQAEAVRSELDSVMTRRLAAEREYIIGQIVNAQAETKRVGDVTQEKFAAIDGLFNSNDKALTAALAAQEKAAAEQQKSNTLAIDKSEKTTQETIKANDAKTASSITAQSETIADIKERVVRLESLGVGAQVNRTETRSDATLSQDARIAADSARRQLQSIVVSALAVLISIIAIIVVIALSKP